MKSTIVTYIIWSTHLQHPKDVMLRLWRPINHVHSFYEEQSQRERKKQVARQGSGLKGFRDKSQNGYS